MHIEAEFDVARPIEEVFDYLADVTNEPKWNPWAASVKKLSEGPVGQGAVFRGAYKRIGELDQDLLIYERPQRLSYHATPKGMREANMIFELRSAGNGTHVRIVGEAVPKGLMKLLEPMMAMQMRPHMRDVTMGIRRELGDGP